MIIHFFIQYRTSHGQAIQVDIFNGKKEGDAVTDTVQLNYYNEESWYAAIDTHELGIKNKFVYSVSLKNEGQAPTEIIPKKTFELKYDKKKDINLYEQIIQQEDHTTVYSSKAFDILKKEDKYKVKEYNPKKPTHIFKVAAPVMQNRYAVCLTGSGDTFEDWSKTKPVILEKKKSYWTVKLDLAKEKFPVEYKLGVYDHEQKMVIHYEEGNNRRLDINEGHEKINVLFLNAPFNQYHWRGTGINVPVSSLRSEKSWGIGDFTDLNLLTDWAASTGMKMIQLLPVNDTIATNTFKDSYPYSANSPFALHPLYLNIQKLGTAFSIDFPEEITEAVKMLNAKPVLDYEGVVSLKMKAIKLVYQLDKQSFRDDFAWIEFFDINRHWLVPYAVFCYLRDKNETPEFENWSELSTYNEADVQEFASPEHDHYEDICLHYFIQYHLHLQLKDAVDYAHKKHIIFKGDLPIGIGRYSVDAWMYPHLFHMDMQAGAPPDYYSVKGQNWSFPTYNWEAMAKDEYKWWRQRMEHLGIYFDAIRIDHVLGFFRIWSIPLTSIEGTLGTFQPAIPVSEENFKYHHLHPDRERLCKPFITYELVNQYFGNDAEFVRAEFLQDNHFKKQYDTQQKICAYFAKDKSKAYLEDSLLRLMSNLVLLEDDKEPGHFHFRINMHLTDSFKQLDDHTRQVLDKLYHEYFFSNQNVLWEAEGIKKITALKSTTDMLLCAEDLGMVPDFMDRVLSQLEILSLQVQRMPKLAADNFSHPKNAPYMSVATPSTHDMSTIREWWQDERQHIQYFFNYILGQQGMAPTDCEPWISTDIIAQHLYSPAMWAVFLIQDILGMNAALRSADPRKDRINDPSNPNHEWNYRMHITLEELASDKDFTHTLHNLIVASGR